MAQKTLKTNLDYNIESAGNIELISNPGGTITLNTGPNTGTTIVTGDLTVMGTTTTVESTVVDIKDNIITLNSGEIGAGVSSGISGIEIDRGSLPNSQILWDDNANEFVLYEEKSPLFTLGALRVRSLQLVNGVVVSNLDNDVTLSGNSSSALPTQYAVKTYVDNTLTANTNRIYQNDTSVTVYDTGIGGSYIETVVDGSSRARLNISGFFINSIGSYTTNSNLTITANGTGEVLIDKVINLPYQVSTPTSVASNNKIYAATPSNGGSGLYFVNTSYSDELVSKRKAILYGIIF